MVEQFGQLPFGSPRMERAPDRLHGSFPRGLLLRIRPDQILEHSPLIGRAIGEAPRIVVISGFTVRPAREGMKLETDPAIRLLGHNRSERLPPCHRC
jgi:hypothetical protein